MPKRLAALFAVAATLTAAAQAQAHEPSSEGEERSATTAPRAAAKQPGTVDLQLLTISDWHGQLTPLGSGTAAVGGAPVLKAYFDRARAANPKTLTFMAGDSTGATPPVSSFFADEPAIRAMNMMGIDADTLGNHNFDFGLERLRRHVELAEFPFVSANLPGLEEEVPGALKRVFRDVDGVRVAIIGITNEEAPTLVAPGSFGGLRVTDGVEAANKAARQARNAGAEVVVVLTHNGVRGIKDGVPFGELINLAKAVDPELVDVVVGDHTDFQYSGLHNGVLAVQNRSKGATFANISLTVDRQEGVLSKGVAFEVPRVSGVTPDAELQAYVDELTRQLRPILGRVIGDSTVRIPRSDACGHRDGRLCESLLGNFVADALRATYGTDFAIVNSGGLRAELTCPGAGASGFCPSGTAPPPFPITRGSVFAVLPFGNVSATTTLSGAEVKAFLEHGVSTMPAANGRFAQVSGLCFTYDIGAPVRSRVTQMVQQAADGSCSGAPILADESYSVTMNDFMASGGDEYPNIRSRVTTRGVMDADVADYITARRTVSSALHGRITCLGSCPTVLAP